MGRERITMKKSSSIRVPVYGMALEIISVLAGMILITSCVTPTAEKMHSNPIPHYPNIVEELDSIKIASINPKSIEYLQQLVNDEVSLQEVAFRHR
jgi:hypothetical protein